MPPFQTLLDAHGGDVYRFLVATVGPVEADDCFQETWISALRAYPRLRHASNLRAWLLQIAQRKAIDSFRARARRPVPVAETREEPAPPPPDPSESEPELFAAVRGLPTKQRLAVVYRCILDLSYAELAEVLESSEEAARRNVHEGLKKLREGWSS